MSSTPHRRVHEDGGSGSGNGNQSHPSVLKYPQEGQGTYSSVGGKVVASPRQDYHGPYDMGQEGRVATIMPRNDLRDADRRATLHPHMLFKVAAPSDCAPENVSTDSRMEFRDPKDGIKDIKVEGREMKSEFRDLQQSRCDSRADDNKDLKHEGDVYAELKSNEKLDKDDYGGSNNQLNWKDFKEQRVKQYPDAPVGNSVTWNMSTTVVLSPADAVKEGGLHVENREFSEARETVGENRVEMKGDDKLKEKDRRRKEVKNWEWGDKDKERSDRQNNLQLGNISGEKKEVIREEREFERRGNEMKEPQKDKDKLIEKVKDHLKREQWNVSDREGSLYDKELLEIPGKFEKEKSTLEPKGIDMFKSIDREPRDKKKERDADVESERSDKRSRYHEKESDEGSMHVEGGAEREKELFNYGVQQRKRMLRPRGSPQLGNRDTRFRSGANDAEGLQSKTDMSCVYKIGECMQELIKLWKEYELSQADKACESSQNGPTLEIRIPAEHVIATNRQVRGGQLWGTDIYTVDSDLVAVLMHTGYCRPTASPPPSGAQELRATIRVVPPQECYISTLRNNVRSRAWGSAVGCSYRVERCCIVKKGGGVIELEPCLTHSSSMEPTLAPVAVERTMTTRAAASNALRQQRFVREVTIQFNLCMEPWLKYSISAVADKGLKKSLFTSARLKKGEVLYVETHSRRYELCFNGEKLTKTSTVPHAQAAEGGRTQTYVSHLTNGERTTADGESSVVDVFRWSRCKRPLPQKFMQRIGVPLPLEHVEVMEENLEWDDISWFQTGAWIAGKEYHLARAHFLAPN